MRIDTTYPEVFGALTLLLVFAAGCSDRGSPSKAATSRPSVTLTLSSGTEIKDPSDEQIRAALKSLDVKRDGEGFAILARSDMTYVQVSGDAKTGFDLEYQEETVDQHYRAEREDYPLDEVVRVLIAYRDGTVRWAGIGHFAKITW
ncbi:MAG: hypothetical protein GX616_02140 [Planctomycetes bacterium]|nr:hypothetical protein [Planctomycetota bacterium]